MDNFKICFCCLIILGTMVSCQSSDQSDQESAASSPPNFLFAISDDQSYPHAGAYGCTWVKTPAFDRVAKEGILFHRAYTPNAKCAPSRACILTGRNSWELEEAANHLPYFPEKFKTFPEVLRENGYSVGRTGKGWSPGVAEKNGQPRELIAENLAEHKTTPPAKYISNNDYAENFRHFLQNRDAEKPFFFWYGATEPHRRYEFGAGIQKAGKKLSDVDKVPPFWPDVDSVRTDMLDYAFEVEYFDQHLAKMLATLEEEGLLENTVVVVTADNGMPFPRIKGQVYERDNHLPLAIMWPKGIKSPGRDVDEFVNFIDFAPTFLELAGISEEKSGMQAIRGQSLNEYFIATGPSANKNYRDHVLLGKERHDVGRPNDEGYPVRGIIKENYLYTVNFKPDRWPAGNPETGYLNCDGGATKTVILERGHNETNSYWTLNFGKRPEEELYSLAEDPYCVNNLANEAALAGLKSQLRQQLFAELREQNDPRVLGRGDIFDQYEAATDGRNYYERFMGGEKVKAGWVNPGDYKKLQQVPD